MADETNPEWPRKKRAERKKKYGRPFTTIAARSPLLTQLISQWRFCVVREPLEIISFKASLYYCPGIECELSWGLFAARKPVARQRQEAVVEPRQSLTSNVNRNECALLQQLSSTLILTMKFSLLKTWASLVKAGGGLVVHQPGAVVSSKLLPVPGVQVVTSPKQKPAREKAMPPFTYQRFQCFHILTCHLKVMGLIDPK